MKSNLYFAYGSNLNTLDLLTSNCGFKKDDLKFVSVAILQDFDLRFTRYSFGRQGGVLDVVKCKDSAVPGVLFEVINHETWKKLDAKEGAPNHYERMSCEVLRCSDKTICRATTYHVIRKLHFVGPTAEYVEIVRKGLIDFELPCEHLDRAVKYEYPTCTW